MYRHAVRVVLGEREECGAGLESDQVLEFDVSSDMLELADPFSLSVPLTPDLWEAAALDSSIRIFIDDSQVLDGFVDERVRSIDKSGGSILNISGRDKGGRLVDESAPLKSFYNRRFADVAKDLVAPWFPKVTFSNATNRALIRGRGRRLASVAQEPAVQVGSRKRVARKVEPGESRAEVLRHFLERFHLLGWSSANGREFVVGLPNYKQAPQFFFFVPRAGSKRFHEGNVLEASYRQSCSERYSEIRVVGSSRGDEASYGRNVTSRTATVSSEELLHDKHLIVVDDDIRTAGEALARAKREMKLREGAGEQLELTVPGFGQALGGDDTTPPALYACDTMSRWEDEELGLKGDWLITAVRYRRSKNGETSQLSLVPRGTELVGR